MHLYTYKEYGQTAEEVAVCFLEEKGFSIDKRNVRFGRAEVDIIARNDHLLVFVEVKMRSSSAFGHAETFVSRRQKQLYHEAATIYIEEIAWPFRIRFDVITLEKQKDGIVLKHFEDAF